MPALAGAFCACEPWHVLKFGGLSQPKNRYSSFWQLERLGLTDCVRLQLHSTGCSFGSSAVAQVWVLLSVVLARFYRLRSHCLQVGAFQPLTRSLPKLGMQRQVLESRGLRTGANTNVIRFRLPSGLPPLLTCRGGVQSPRTEPLIGPNLQIQPGKHFRILGEVRKSSCRPIFTHTWCAQSAEVASGHINFKTFYDETATFDLAALLPSARWISGLDLTCIR